MSDNILETMRAEAEEQLKQAWAGLTDEERVMARQMAVQLADFSVSLTAQVRALCEVTGIGKKISVERWDVIVERSLRAAATMYSTGCKYADAMGAKDKESLS